MAELRELSDAECRSLLARHHTGRVALSTPDGPQIVPLTYLVVDDAIVFRTSPFSVLATYGRNSTIAVEIDHFRDDLQLAWSVVVRGRAAIVTDPGQLTRIREASPSHLSTESPRSVYLQVECRELTGRSLDLPPALDPQPA